MPQRPSTSFDMERIDARLAACDRLLDSANHTTERRDQLAALGTIVGAIAHEFNGLLTPLHGQAQRVLAAPNDPVRAKQLAERTLASTERGRALINAILALAVTEHPAEDDTAPPNSSRITGPGEPASAGAPPPSASEHDVPDEPCPACRVNDALHEVFQELGADASRIVADVSPEACVQMSPIALQRILINLLNNALHADRSGGPVRVTTAAHEPDLFAELGDDCSTWNSQARDTDRQHPDTADAPAREPAIDPASDPAREPAGQINPDVAEGCTARSGAGWVWLTVQDSGPGIAADHIASIFQPFYTFPGDHHQQSAPAGSTRSQPPETPLGSGPRAQGTGLGLTIVRGLTEQSGGSINVATKPRHGTIFQLRLPAASPKTGP